MLRVDHLGQIRSNQKRSIERFDQNRPVQSNPIQSDQIPSRCQITSRLAWCSAVLKHSAS